MQPDSAKAPPVAASTHDRFRLAFPMPRRGGYTVDPRWFQIAVLATLLTYGLAARRIDVSVTGGRIAATLTAVLGLQWLCSRWAGLPRLELKSAAISALSLCLLLRADSFWPVLFGAAVAIASKFVLRFRGCHVFNPTALGISAALLLTGHAWISPGQWGNDLLLALFVVCLGFVVLQRAARADVTLAFLLIYPGLIFGRALWLGDPWSIPLHQMGNGALLIFAFFMISDPRTIPATRTGRILFAASVAVAAYVLRFRFYEPNALVFALVACAPLRLAIDGCLGGEDYEWRGRVRNEAVL